MPKNIRFLFVIVIFNIFIFNSNCYSQILDRNLFGGNGGNFFNDNPKLDFKVASIEIRAGVFIDSIKVNYRPPNHFPPREPHGGNGGNHYVFYLNQNEHITAISGRSGKFVDAIRIHTNYRVSPLYGGPGGYRFFLSAPNNYHVIGFYGRSGTYLDAIGIIFTPN